jgi:hypothetical protein
VAVLKKELVNVCWCCWETARMKLRNSGDEVEAGERRRRRASSSGKVNSRRAGRKILEAMVTFLVV